MSARVLVGQDLPTQATGFAANQTWLLVTAAGWDADADIRAATRAWIDNTEIHFHRGRCATIASFGWCCDRQGAGDDGQRSEHFPIHIISLETDVGLHPCI